MEGNRIPNVMATEFMLKKRSLIWVQALSMVARNVLTRKRFSVDLGLSSWKRTSGEFFAATALGPSALRTLHTLLLLHLYTCISLSKSTRSASSLLSRLNTFTELMRQLRPQSRCETTVIRLALVRSTTILQPFYDRSTTIYILRPLYDLRPFNDHFRLFYNHFPTILPPLCRSIL